MGETAQRPFQASCSSTMKVILRFKEEAIADDCCRFALSESARKNSHDFLEYPHEFKPSFGRQSK